MRVTDHVVIYTDEQYYSSFPSIVRRPDGELLVAFRRAPDRAHRFGTTGHTHADPNSHLVLVRSNDNGRTWTPDPELICAHPHGGSQDPCMVQLDDGTLVCTSYLWTMVPQRDTAAPGRVLRVLDSWDMGFLGGYLVRSADGGATWSPPIYPMAFQNDNQGCDGAPLPAFNRGAMTQADDGNLYWVVVRTPQETGHAVLELLVSSDRGLTWTHRSQVAGDQTVVMNETSVIQTDTGDLVAFSRTSNFGDHGVLTRSRDLGQTWEPWEDLGGVGHPYHAVRLPDGCILIVYGYRHPPYGIRAQVLNPDCSAHMGDEIVLRDDGGSGDLGYPWACLTADGNVLVTYYINIDENTRHIAGTFLEPA
jgi:hypothetical protein